MRNPFDDLLGRNSLADLAGRLAHENALKSGLGTTNPLADLARGSLTAKSAFPEAGLGRNSLADLAGRFAHENALKSGLGTINPLADLARGSLTAKSVFDEADLGRNSLADLTSLSARENALMKSGRDAAFADRTNAFAAQANALRSADAGVRNSLSELVRDRSVWERLGGEHQQLRDAAPPLKIDFPDFAGDLRKALDAGARRDRELQLRHSELLGSMVEGAKRQNEVMTEIATSQALLVKEAIENSRIQRIVLYFAALSAALALLALFK